MRRGPVAPCVCVACACTCMCVWHVLALDLGRCICGQDVGAGGRREGQRRGKQVEGNGSEGRGAIHGEHDGSQAWGEGRGGMCGG